MGRGVFPGGGGGGGGLPIPVSGSDPRADSPAQTPGEPAFDRRSGAHRPRFFPVLGGLTVDRPSFDGSCWFGGETIFVYQREGWRRG